MASFRESSKQMWSSNETVEHINAGSLQRIADATETMAKNYVSLQSDLETYKRWYAESQKRITTLVRSNNALRGYIKSKRGKKQ